MEEQTKAIADLTAVISAMSAKIDAIHPVVLDLQGWKPAIERSVDELRAEVGDLRGLLQEKGKSVEGAPAAPLPSNPSPQPPTRLLDLPPLIPLAVETNLARLAEGAQMQGGGSHGPIGHGRTTDHRGMSPGYRSPRAPPVTGTFDSHLPFGESSYTGERGFGFSRYPPPPRLEFPLFDGDGPHAWRLKCEAYFRVCTLSPDTWVSCAAMYFIDGALSWLQSTKAHLVYQEWEGFAMAVCEQFGREEFQSLLRQFNRLRQTGAVTEYAEKFTQFMHNLMAHHASWEPTYFITHFIDGLQKEIRAAVVLHRPKTLDTAVDLACLQEEVMEAMRKEDKREDRRYTPAATARPVPRTALPLPPPPPSAPPKSSAPPETRSADRRTVEAAHAPSEDRIAALRAYRRARGLCFTCGERWGRDHRCGPTVQLHVVEELIDMMRGDPTTADEHTPAGSVASEAEADCCVICKEAVEGAESATTMRLHGWVQDREVLMLVDSGSSHSFVCESLAEQLSGMKVSDHTMAVRVANGGVLQCNRELPACPWRTQGVTFHTDLKVLPLGCYDMILGIDWLAQRSPMNVHWGGEDYELRLQWGTSSIARGSR
ncbi:uncharacterized protein [Aegilops tauschii subsp. strangulata]|uniref:uncharacterized protein n=1 Tax=Aegilops tauschii subsp. strangulata TaxID=200361 RepID=UPI001E1CA5C1|nr:uncharacterized protein LOC123495176 [Aegilops tauschii subsp. strangulata]